MVGDGRTLRAMFRTQVGRVFQANTGKDAEDPLLGIRVRWLLVVDTGPRTKKFL